MKITRLSQAYDFPGFKAISRVHELLDTPTTVIVTLRRTYEKKDRNARNVVPARRFGMIARSNGFGITTAGNSEYTWSLKLGAYNARSVAW
jgi:hypothetical protein